MSPRTGRRARVEASRGIGPGHPLAPILGKALARMDRTQRRYVERRIRAGRWGVVEPGERPGELHLVIEHGAEFVSLGEVPAELMELVVEQGDMAETAG